jgi:hypothetical protein
MPKAQKSGVIRLDEEAINSMSVMLMELLSEEKNLKINHSKLASFILSEFHSKHFEKAKSRLVLAHQDKKKCIMNQIEGLGLEELEATIKYLEKIKKTDFSLEKSKKI